MSDLTLEQAADILSKNNDEVMFLVQTGKLRAGIDQDSMTWSFALNDVLAAKKTLDEETENSAQLLVE